MIDRFGPGVGHLNYLAVPGVGIFEFLTTNHFLGWGILVTFDLTFLPGVGNLTLVFGEMSKSRPRIFGPEVSESRIFVFLANGFDQNHDKIVYVR